MNISAGYLTDEDLLLEYERLNKHSYEYFSILSELKLRNLISIEKFFNNEFKITSSNSHFKYSSKEFYILNDRYKEKNGRIYLPNNAQDLWRQHKYAIMARNINLYKEIGKRVSSENCFDELTDILVYELRKRPKKSGIFNALQHMWGYISEYSEIKKIDVNSLSLYELFLEVQQSTLKSKESYLSQQVALSEFEIWILEEGNYVI